MKSIRWKFVALYIVLVTIVIMVSGSLMVYLTRDREYSRIKNELRDLALIIETSVSNDLAVQEIKESYIDLLDQGKINLLSPNTKIYLLDNKGKIIYSLNEININEQIFSSQVVAATRGEVLENFDEVKTLGGQDTYLGLALPIKSVQSSEQVDLIFYLLKSTKEVEDSIARILYVIVYALLASIVLAAFLGILFSNYLTKPIAALTKKAGDMAQGKLKTPIRVESSDEIGELSRSFNNMAQSLDNMLYQRDIEKRKMETIIKYMADGILVFDEKGSLIHSNPAAVKMLGIDLEDHYRALLYNQIQVSYSQLIREIDRKPTTYSLENARGHYSLSFANYHEGKSKSGGVICVIQDITKYKELEKLQKEFVANVSHELRTPITTIKSYAETLIDMPDLSEISYKFLATIDRESNKMTTLIQDLLELSKLDIQGLDHEFKPINMGILVKEVVKSFEIVVARKAQKIFLDIDENNSYMVMGEPNKLEQVIKNLLSNAVKYSDRGATINLGVYGEGDQIITYVEDTGMGIKEEDLARVFERFYRVDKARSRAMGGTGLGLAIAKEIIDYHQGQIKVQSTYGKGSKFTIVLAKI